jgi:prevent-host-death family protein
VVSNRRGPTKPPRGASRAASPKRRRALANSESRASGIGKHHSRTPRSIDRHAIETVAAAPRAIANFKGWKLEDAKAQFSELVRRARNEGPQRVTVRGKDAVVVISAEELDQLLPQGERVPFVAFMESLYLDGLDLTREPDFGRDIKL